VAKEEWMHSYAKRIGVRSLALAATSVCFAVASTAVLVPAATADPTNAKDSFTSTLVCSNGQTFPVSNTGNTHAANGGPWNPAFDVTSTSVFVPSVFAPSTDIITNTANGMVVDMLSVPADAKGNTQGAGATPLTCSFTFSDTFTLTSSVTLPDGTMLGPGTYTNSGVQSVTGFIPSQK
jgi:hypothetical protein